MTRRIIGFLAALALLGGASPAGRAALGEPQLMWDRGGCTHWCMTGWYGSPALDDLDGNGTVEVVWASYKLWVLDAATGAEYWSVYAGHDVTYGGSDPVGRTWSSPVVADLDGDGWKEIAVAHSGGWIGVYDLTGRFEPGWPVQASPDSELRTLAAYDLDGDGDLEILVASTSFGSDEEWYVYEHDGQARSGWPQHDGSCSAAGCFNQNVAVADLDGDGRGEVIGPNDTHYVCAFADDGTCLPAHPMYEGRRWGEVGVWVDMVAELRGWGYCGTEHRPNFCHSSPSVADLDGDGRLEVVHVGNVHDCSTNPYTDLYEVPIVWHPDRSRFQTTAFDWSVWPAPPHPGAWQALSQDWHVVESCQPNPTLADVDGDGCLEILYPSYDGRVHCFHLDGTEHDAWPYAVTRPGEGFIRFASEVLAADLDGDGGIEVIFGSWTEKSSGAPGRLHILDARGQPIHEQDLPHDPGEWNGILGAPSLADIDADGELELVAGTSATGIVAYDLPGARGGRILWGTGRGNLLRCASLEEPRPEVSLDLTVNGSSFSAGDVMHVGLGYGNAYGPLASDLYLGLLAYGIPLFAGPDPVWPTFDAEPYRFRLAPLPPGELEPVTILDLPLGDDPLPDLQLEWFALLLSADTVNLMALDLEEVSIR